MRKGKSRLAFLEDIDKLSRVMIIDEYEQNAVLCIYYDLFRIRLLLFEFQIQEKVPDPTGSRSDHNCYFLLITY